jgi:hypothetical protein
MGSREHARRGHVVAIACPGDGELARRAREGGAHRVRRLRLPQAETRRVARARRRAPAPGDRDLPARSSSTRTARRTRGPRSSPTASADRAVPHLLTRHNSKRVADNAANRWLYRRGLDRLVVVSRGVLERYEAFFRRGVLDPARVPVIPSSIDFARYDAALDPARLRAELGSGCRRADRRTGGPARSRQGTGRPRPRVRRGPREAPHAAHLVYVGTGTQEPALRALAAEDGPDRARSFPRLPQRRTEPHRRRSTSPSSPSSTATPSPASVRKPCTCAGPSSSRHRRVCAKWLTTGKDRRVVRPAMRTPLERAIVAALDDPAGLRRRWESVRERSCGHAKPRRARGPAYEKALRGPRQRGEAGTLAASAQHSPSRSG